jgi:hypothetical protein
LIEAVSPGYQPENDTSRLFEERRAILRILLYIRYPCYVLPTVQKEYKRIKRTNWRNEHEEFTQMLLRDYLGEFDNSELINRQKILCSYHDKKLDCQILAEAEAAHMDILLTCDKKFIKRLGSRTMGVRMMKPTEYLQGLNILPGSKPVWRPSPSNPLSKKTWWEI